MNSICIKVMDFKKKICISDTIGAYIMIQEQTVIHKMLLIGEACDLFLDISSGKHRNTGQCFRIFLRFLISLKCFCALYHLGKLFIRKTAAIILQPLFKLLISFCSEAALRYQRKNGTVGIVQKILADQFLKISFFCCLLEEFKPLQKLYLAEWFLIIIKPAA